MSGEGLTEALRPLLDRLVSAAAADPGLRAELVAVAERLLGALAGAPVAANPAAPAEAVAAGATTEPSGSGGAPSAQAPPPSTPPTPPPAAIRPLLPPVIVGPRVVLVGAPDRQADVPEVPFRVPTDDELRVIETRCRLKADACRWVAARAGGPAGTRDPGELDPAGEAIADRARKLGDCQLWMLPPDGPAAAAALEVLGGCFTVTADALAYMYAVQTNPDRTDAEVGAALSVLAEAQSALRMAVLRAGSTAVDADQLRAFQWLRDTGRALQIYIARHMRVEDPAPPDAWPDRAKRVAAAADALGARLRQDRDRRSGLNKVRYHLKRITGGSDDGSGFRRDWEVVAAAVDQVVAAGMPPSSVELRDVLLPVIEQVPDDLAATRSLQLVAREIDRYLADRPDPDPPAPATPEQSEAVRAVAALLAGRVVVMIGGVPRRHARQGLIDALSLADLDWIGTREHESIAPFEAHVARPEVAVVLLAIRWSSHSFEGVKAFCDAHGKPLVRLPAGYNPNQVAVQILRQCGDRLGG